MGGSSAWDPDNDDPPELVELFSVRPNGDEIFFSEEAVLIGYKRVPDETPTPVYPPNQLRFE